MRRKVIRKLKGQRKREARANPPSRTVWQRMKTFPFLCVYKKNLFQADSRELIRLSFRRSYVYFPLHVIKASTHGFTREQDMLALWNVYWLTLILSQILLVNTHKLHTNPVPSFETCNITCNPLWDFANTSVLNFKNNIMCLL